MIRGGWLGLLGIAFALVAGLDSTFKHARRALRLAEERVLPDNQRGCCRVTNSAGRPAHQHPAESRGSECSGSQARSGSVRPNPAAGFPGELMMSALGLASSCQCAHLFAAARRKTLK